MCTDRERGGTEPWKTNVLHQQFPSAATLSQRPKWNISLEWQTSLFNMGGGGREGTWSYPMALWSPLSHVRLNVAEELISPLANKTPKPCSSWPKEERDYWERGAEWAGAGKWYDSTGFTKSTLWRFVLLISVLREHPVWEQGPLYLKEIPHFHEISPYSPIPIMNYGFLSTFSGEIYPADLNI